MEFSNDNFGADRYGQPVVDDGNFWNLFRSATTEDNEHGFEEDFDVLPEGPVLGVEQLELDAFVEVQLAAATYLP